MAEYGKDVTTIYDKMKQVISNEVKKMTGLDVIEINVNVVDVKRKNNMKMIQLLYKIIFPMQLLLLENLLQNNLKNQKKL